MYGNNKPVYVAVNKDKTNDSLRHHKYIKREWKNGKWRYYYALNKVESKVKKDLDYTLNHDPKYEESRTISKNDYDKLSKAEQDRIDKLDDEMWDKAKQQRDKIETIKLKKETLVKDGLTKRAAEIGHKFINDLLR